jgi:hypothetical protein
VVPSVGPLNVPTQEEAVWSAPVIVTGTRAVFVNQSATT